MKKLLIVAVIASSMIAASATSVQAQNNVAIIDLNYIFRELPSLKEKNDRFNNDVKATEAKFKADQEAMETQIQQFRTNPEFKRGTAEYKQLEEELIRKQQDFKTDVALKQREFNERRARIAFSVYQDIMKEVRYHAEKNKLSMVLQFNGDPVDPNDGNSIQRELNKALLWYDEAIDITPMVLDALTKKRAAPATGGTKKPAAR